MPTHTQQAGPLTQTPVYTGQDRTWLKRENKRKRVRKQELQEPTSHWTTHLGKFVKSTTTVQPLSTYRGQMCPSGLALQHPAAELLKSYATEGCPTNTGRDWSPAEMQSAIDRGPHRSALAPDAIVQHTLELQEKIEKGQARVVSWDDIKDNPPAKLKISPLAMIPHKSRKYRALLDLSFPVKLETYTLDSVNDCTVKTAPPEALDQLGHSLQRIIAALAATKDEDAVYLAKFDIKDGFWRLVCEEGAEWNFAYVLPQEEGQPVKLVIPTSLQMGWIESPGYFCAASETARDTASDYAEMEIGTLQDHKFLHHTQTSQDFKNLPVTQAHASPFRYLLDVYMDDFIALAIPRDQHDLNHLANSVMHGTHDVFPPDPNAAEDPISLKKLEKGEGAWALVQEVLGWQFNGADKTLCYNEKKLDIILQGLKQMLRSRRGVPFTDFEKLMGKARHAATGVPGANGLFSPINRILGKRPTIVWIRPKSDLRRALTDLRVILREANREPTHCKELVVGHPNTIGIVDAAKEGVGGVVFGETEACIPTVFRLEWPKEIQDQVITFTNKTGTLTNSDLEMAGLLLLWLVMEATVSNLKFKHVALFSDNSPSVSWVERMASQRSKVAGGLLRALALRMRVRRSSPLIPLHIPGQQNKIADLPSRSFGGTPEWHCPTDTQFLTLFNDYFPLPQQQSWQLFHLSPEVSTRVISLLQMRDTEMDVWRRLPQIGRRVGPIGKSTANLWEWTLTFRSTPRPSKQKCAYSPDLPHEQEAEHLAAAAKLQLQQFLRRSQPLARRSRWTPGQTPSKPPA